MAALTAPLFRTWSPISDLQRIRECLFEPSMIKSKKLHICKRRVSQRIAPVYHADNRP